MLSLDAESVYVFRHALLRDAAYQLQLPGDRARQHELAADLIEMLLARTSAAVTGPAAGEIADHLRVARTGNSSRRLLLRERRFALEAAECAEKCHQLGEAARFWRRHAEISERGEAPASIVREARVNARLGRTAHAVALLKAAARRARKPAVRASALGLLASSLHTLGETSAAENTYRRALKICRGRRFHRARLLILGDYRGLLRETGRGREALRLGRMLVTEFRRIGDRSQESTALNNLGQTLRESGAPAEAGSCLRKALGLARRCGHVRSEAYARLGLAQLAAMGGGWAGVRSHATAACAIYRAIGDRRFEATALSTLAIPHREAREIAAAEALVLRALALHDESGDVRSAGLDWHELANIRDADGRWKEAESAFASALERIRRIEDHRTEARILRDIAEVRLERGHLDGVKELLQQSLTLHRSVQDPRGEGVTLGVQGQLDLARRNWASATAHFRRALSRDRAAGNPRFEGLHRCQLALSLALGNRPRVAAEWTAGAELLRASGCHADLEKIREDARRRCRAEGVRAPGE